MFISRTKNKYTIFSVIFLVVGVLSALIFPVSKNRVTASYVLITLAASAILLRVFDIVFKTNKSGTFLVCWGANPLLLYVLNKILLGFIVLPGVSWWYQGALPYIVALQTVLLLGILTLIARALYTRQTFIKL